MKTIYKYPLRMSDEQTVEMPKDADILCVQMQHNVPCIWAIVEPENRAVLRKLRVCGTGHPVNFRHDNYIGTFQLLGGELIFHVFDLGE